MKNQLPVFATWALVFKTLEQHAAQYTTAALVPFLIWIGQGILLSDQVIPFSVAILTILLNMLLQIWLCISMIRITLFGKAPKTIGVFYWGWRETRFTLYAGPLVVILAGVSALVIALKLYVLPDWSPTMARAGYFGMLFAMVGLLYLFSRCVVLYASLAADQPLSLPAAWRMTKGLGLRVMTIVFILPAVVNWVLGILLGATPMPPAMLGMLEQIMGLILTLLGLNALACVYKQLSQ